MVKEVSFCSGESMNEKALKIIEYPKIINMLALYAGSEPGRKKCMMLKPSVKLMDILNMQEQTEDALTRIYGQGSVSFSGLTDIGLSLKRLELEGALSTKELLSIARLLDIALSVKQYGDIHTEEKTPDSLSSMFASLTPLESLSRDIHRAILSETEIADDASSALKEIRHAIKRTNDSIHAKLSAIVSSQTNQTMLQDHLVTMRNGRYCIPVRQEYRSQFPGMIHDQSKTGSTLFIEPMAVVNLNNERKELANQEAVEIEKILSNLSGQAASNKELIEADMNILAELDFIFARALFARSYQGTRPEFSTDGPIQIKEGRHPLLDPKKVVPINLTLGEDFTMLIVTGPNTGGKTVSLKTLGLFTVMGQAGLHIPAFDGSKLRVFQDVFADIGDEQSIEMSLSTFSSHMTNIVSIVNAATPDTLVLFDELGGGTDPAEGAALAISILTHLNRKGIFCMATTHYSELKTFALSTPGIENACCEFDISSLRPTYKLMIGIPGKSNAFAIAGRLGLPKDIIEEAKGQMDQSAIDFEALLADLEHSKTTIDREREEITSLKAETEALKNQLKEKQISLAKQKADLLQEARQEARDIIQEAKDYADEAIRKYNRLGKHAGNNQAMEAERSRLGKRVKHLDSQLQGTNKKRTGTHKASDFKLGDTVWVISMNLEGTITSVPNSKGYAAVQMGILNSNVHISDLELKSAPDKTPSQAKESGGHTTLMKSVSIKPELYLLGMTVDEAIPKLDKYLDDAALAHLNQVRIIHGKGTGALRKGVQEYLKKQPLVKNFRSGEFGEGDMGVTIVEL